MSLGLSELLMSFRAVELMSFRVGKDGHDFKKVSKWGAGREKGLEERFISPTEVHHLLANMKAIGPGRSQKITGFVWRN